MISSNDSSVNVVTKVLPLLLGSRLLSYQETRVLKFLKIFFFIDFTLAKLTILM
ncbi:hypothetical protein Mapa_001520 [Marchantia paleacea]|nr:hypothetical protein Mapa_001520 [Marchantia paleacea]